MDSLGNWILALTATGLICGAVRALTPAGTVKKAVTAVCGFAMAAAMLSIVGDVDALGISRYAARYNEEARIYTDSALQGARAQTRFIIEERCEAYILDKAALLNVSLGGVEVTARWSDEGFWYPAAARLSGKRSPELSRILAAELGIPEEDQIWSESDET